MDKIDIFWIVIAIVIVFNLVWIMVDGALEEDEEFGYEMPEYSCKEVRDFILIEMYPTKDVKIIKYINFKFFKDGNRSTYFQPADYRKYYEENCLNEIN